jgi:uncharacterized protein (TIGR00369 family)
MEQGMQADPVASRPYYRMLGIRNEPCTERGRSTLRIESRPEFENSRGEIHGGVVASLLDAAMAVAVRSACEPGQGAATISMTVNYVQPGRGTLVAHGTALRTGRSVASAEARVVDAAGALVAHAIGTMRVIAART